MGGEFMQRAPLGALVSPCNEKAVGAKRGDWPYVGFEHIDGDSPDLRRAAHSSVSASTNGVFQKGDVLFGKLRPYLRKSVAAPFDGYCSTDLLVLRPNEQVDPGFAAKVFQSPAVFAEAVATSIGTKMPRTSWAALRGMAVFAPPLPEQRRIAEILDTLDAAIRTTEQVIAKLQQMKQGLLHDLLTRGIDDNGALRPPPDEAPHLYQASPLGPIPRGWEVAPFSAFASERRPFLKTGPFGSSLKGEHWTETGVPVTTIGALGEGEFDHDELLYVTERKAASLSAYVVVAGDIVFSRVADVGRSVVVSAEESGWLMSSNLMWISLDQTRIEPEYVWLNLSGSPNVRRQIRCSVNAGGREVANGPILKSLRLAWPCREEQCRIVDAARSPLARTQRERDMLAKLRALKQGLVDDLLTGRVRVAVPTEATPRTPGPRCGPPAEAP